MGTTWEFQGLGEDYFWGVRFWVLGGLGFGVGILWEFWLRVQGEREDYKQKCTTTTCTLKDRNSGTRRIKSSNVAPFSRYKKGSFKGPSMGPLKGRSPGLILQSLVLNIQAPISATSAMVKRV